MFKVGYYIVDGFTSSVVILPDGTGEDIQIRIVKSEMFDMGFDNRKGYQVFLQNDDDSFYLAQAIIPVVSSDEQVGATTFSPRGHGAG